jgi:hypothetical protein
MTEFNLFCYSEKYNDDNSFQQPRFRVFNTQVTKNRYNELVTLIKNIIPNPRNLNLIDFWKSITQSQWNQLLAIPEAVNFKEGFEFISGCTIETSIIGTTQNVVIDGISYKVLIQELS